KSVIGPALRNVSLHQRAVLQRILEQELAPNLAGLTPIEVLERMKRAVDTICSTFREGVSGWLDKPPEPTGTSPVGSGKICQTSPPHYKSRANCNEGTGLVRRQTPHEPTTRSKRRRIPVLVLRSGRNAGRADPLRSLTPRA